MCPSLPLSFVPCRLVLLSARLAGSCFLCTWLVCCNQLQFRAFLKLSQYLHCVLMRLWAAPSASMCTMQWHCSVIQDCSSSRSRTLIQQSLHGSLCTVAQNKVHASFSHITQLNFQTSTGSRLCSRSGCTVLRTAPLPAYVSSHQYYWKLQCLD